METEVIAPHYLEIVSKKTPQNSYPHAIPNIHDSLSSVDHTRIFCPHMKNVFYVAQMKESPQVWNDKIFILGLI